MLSLCLAISHHLLAGEWNEVHPCIRYQDDAFIAGAFLNSESRVSLYAGMEFRAGQLFAEAGIAAGYSGGAIVPFVRGGVDIGKSTRLFVAPAYNVDSGEFGAVFGMELTFD